MNPLNLSEINIDSLSISDIEKLLPQLQIALEDAKQNTPIYEVVDKTFSEIWQPIESTLKDKFLSRLQTEKTEFILRESIKVVLEKSIGTEYTKDFFKTINLCLKEKNFRKTGKFYEIVKDPSAKKVVQVGIVVYRFNKSLTSEETFIGGKWVRTEIAKVKSIDNPVIKTVVNDFNSVGLIPA